jgi:Tol biopolymer transport system component
VYLYAAPRQGGDAVRLNPEGAIAACNAPPCLRAAGDALLLMTFDADYAGNQLYDIDLSSSSLSARLLTTFAAETLIDFLAVSPDSSQVLLFATDAAGEQAIYLIDRSAAAPSVTRIFEPAAVQHSLYWPLGWSPDSRFLDLRVDPDDDGYMDLFAVAAGNATAALPAPLTPQGRKITSVGAEWRPLPLR